MPQMPLPMDRSMPEESVDPVQVIADIRAMLDQLEKSLGPVAPEAPEEFEPQDDADVVAGIPPRKKTPSPMGA